MFHSLTWGMICLAIYLFCVGIVGLFGVDLGGLRILPALLALLAAVLIILGK